MSKIRIKNFGPIKEGYQENGGWLDVKKVTVFIGNQGSGKSTVAKTISTLSWLEKALNRGDIEKDSITFNDFFVFFEYHKIHNYFTENTEIEYIGKKYHVLFDRTKKYPIIKEVKSEEYVVPKIMYIPSERNFLSAVSNAFTLKGLPESVFTFAEELKLAQKELNGQKLLLPIAKITYEYNDKEDESYILGKGYKISLSEASSGLQSFIPLFIVSKSLSQFIDKSQDNTKKELTVTQALRFSNEILTIMNDNSLSNKDKNKLTESIRAKYFDKCFINIVEEPEQNLFPSSQWEMLKSLLEFNNMNKGNKLVMTTHSPYLINYLTLAIKAKSISEKLDPTQESVTRINNIVPIGSMVSWKDTVIYELNEKDGSIKRLGNFEGIPSDKNFLNQSLAKGNQLFDSLLEIEEEL